LTDSGVPSEKISIVVAIGTHEAMKKEALEARLGSAVVSLYKVVQHNAKQSDLVPIQIPGHDGAVKINPVVARADLRVGISSVLPHPMAGYGGGPKILMPGICDFDFIRSHHMTHVKHPRSVAGVTKGNPFHESCFRVARAIGLDFSIECVYNQKGQVIRVIGGSLERTFAEAVETCFEKLGQKFTEKVDVTITSTYPHTHGHQIMKGLSAPDVITKETGAILLVAPVVAPIPPDFLTSILTIKERSGNNPVAYINDALSKGMAFLPDKAIDYNMAMTSVFLRPKIRTKSYSNANVAIFPSGGLIVPITSWER
jgi:nickel-dependent lactate racemase